MIPKKSALPLPNNRMNLTVARGGVPPLFRVAVRRGFRP
jgi:hypothetical protein